MISTGVERGDEVWEEYQAICPLALPILIVLHLSPFFYYCLILTTYLGFLIISGGPETRFPRVSKE